LIKTASVALVQRRAYRFVLGIVLGVASGATLVLVFSSASIPGWLGDGVLSAMTYAGFALILFGYFYRRGKTRNFASDFTLAIGIGIILVWFIGAGNGTITFTDLPFGT
jgi:hypothetical protein